MQPDLLIDRTEMSGLSSSKAFHARLLGDHLVVIDKNREELRVLNPTSSLIWLLLDEKAHNAETLTQSLRDLDSCLPENFSSLLAVTLQEWNELGWFEEVSSTVRIARDLRENTEFLRQRGVSYPPKKQLPPYKTVAHLFLRLGGVSFRIEFGDTGSPGFPSTLARLHGVLRGLSDSAPAENPVELRWVHDGESFWFANASEVLVTADESFALSSVVTLLFQQAYPNSGLFATFHAAALGKGGNVIVLPGVSGAGKSTLSAYLAAHEWDYLGDDVVALGRVSVGGCFELHAFPTAIGLKPKSWPILRPFYPCLDDCPIISYADRQARFVPVQRRDFSSSERQFVRRIVFPSYVEGADISIEALTPIEALCQLIISGLTTGSSFQHDQVEVLFQMLEEVTAYRLTHGSLQEADRALSELLK